MSDVVDDDGAVCIAVVHGRQRLVPLLSGRIPNLKLDCGCVVEGYRLCEEGGADGGFSVVVELVLAGRVSGLIIMDLRRSYFYESQYQGTLYRLSVMIQLVVDAVSSPPFRLPIRLGRMSAILSPSHPAHNQLTQQHQLELRKASASARSASRLLHSACHDSCLLCFVFCPCEPSLSVVSVIKCALSQERVVASKQVLFGILR